MTLQTKDTRVGGSLQTKDTEVTNGSDKDIDDVTATTPAGSNVSCRKETERIDMARTELGLSTA